LGPDQRPVLPDLRSRNGGENYERLVALKNEHDPVNVFRLDHNIEPTG
jgi:Berberine and berberine like